MTPTRWLLVGAAVVVGYVLYESYSATAYATVPTNADAILNAAQAAAAANSSTSQWRGVTPAPSAQRRGTPPVPSGAPPAASSAFVPSATGPAVEGQSGRRHF